ncbi:MAG: hypothetical protein ACLFPL_03590 [Candidatus Nanoarchaeia archaeon]
MYSKQAAAGVIASFIILTFIVIISVTMMISYQSFVIDSQERFEERQNDLIKTSQISYQLNNITYNTTTENLEFIIENTGSIDISSSELSYFLDETFLSNVTPTRVDDASFEVELLEPSSRMQINYSITLNDGNYSLQVIHDLGLRQIETLEVS